MRARHRALRAAASMLLAGCSGTDVRHDLEIGQRLGRYGSVGECTGAWGIMFAGQESLTKTTTLVQAFIPRGAGAACDAVPVAPSAVVRRCQDAFTVKTSKL